MEVIPIPDQFLSVFEKLRDMSVAEYEALLDALNSAGPTMTTAPLERAISTCPAFETSEAAREFAVVFAGLLAMGRQNYLSLDELARGTAASPNVSIPEKDRSLLADRIAGIGTCLSIQVMSRAKDMRDTHERLFHDVRIVTDVRPIFDGDSAESPKAALLRHILNLSYIDDQGTLRSFLVALDEEDLDALELNIEGAREDGSRLKSLLQSAGVSYIGWSEDD